MKKTLIWKPVLAVVGGSLLMTGCVVRERVVYRTPPPPPMAVDPGAEVEVGSEMPPPQEDPTVVVGVAPAPGYIWIAPYWAWSGGGWVWTHGRWGYPPRPGVRWYGPHYAYRGGRHVYVRGGWR